MPILSRKINNFRGISRSHNRDVFKNSSRRVISCTKRNFYRRINFRSIHKRKVSVYKFLQICINYTVSN